MADFIDFEVSVEHNTKEEDLDSLNSFIDDENYYIENDKTFY